MNNIILNSQHGLHKSEKSVTITIYQLTCCKGEEKEVVKDILLGKGVEKILSNDKFCLM